MGIEGFHPFLKKKAPSVYREIHLSEYAGKRVAVDISGLIFKYKILNKDKWLDSFAYLIFALRRNQIHPLFVYEGVAPSEKDDEKLARAKQRKALQNKVSDLRTALDKYYESGEVEQVLIDTTKKLPVAPSLGSFVVNTVALEKQYKKIEAQVVHFTEEELHDLNTLFDLCGVQYTTAAGEAEAFCSALARSGKVDAVVSNDSDVSAHGARKFLYNINGLTSTCTEIDREDILKGLGLTSEQFLDFCIMCGNDYNSNMPGIGPVNSFNLITKFKSIENLPKNYDTTVLNYVRSRELFNIDSYYDPLVLSKTPKSVVDIFNFLKLKNTKIKFPTVEKSFGSIEIIFED